jgi:hypothetical protein
LTKFLDILAKFLDILTNWRFSFFGVFKKRICFFNQHLHLTKLILLSNSNNMGASGAVSKSDVESLKSAVKTLQTKVKSLETITVDDKAIKALSQSIDYLKLKDNINMGDLSTEVLKSPGALADAVAQSFNKDAGRMVPIATALADNETFAKTLADTLTDTSGKYRSALRGDKGETGDISTSKDAVKAALYDKKYTLWCADGDVCQVPAGTKALNLGVLGFSNDWDKVGGNMAANGKNSHIADDRTTYKKLMLVGNNSGGGSRQVGVWDDLSVSGNLTVGGNKIFFPNGWSIEPNNSEFIIAKNGEAKAWFDAGGGFYGKAYGGPVHLWPGFVRTNQVYGIGSVERGGWLSNQGNAVFKGGDKAGWEKVRFEQY